MEKNERTGAKEKGGEKRKTELRRTEVLATDRK